MKRTPIFAAIFLSLISTVLIAGPATAQSPLKKVIPIDVHNQRLDNVLEILSNKGNFYFSYNSNIIKRDSLVTLSYNNKTVKQLLELIFNDNYEFKESGNYIIIRKAPIKLAVITNQAESETNIYTVSGFVLDEESGERISNASIYEKQKLISTLTDANGYFKLRLKTKSETAFLTVSKEYYEDTTVMIRPKFNQQLTITISPSVFNGKTITISPEDILLPDTIAIDVTIDSAVTRYLYLKADSFKVEKTDVANFLLSSKQKIQSLNLKRFFADRPFQFSLIPGVSTHGKMGSQVINNFSLNLFGGYTGGVKGLEIGGLFNIDKKNVRYLQASGIFNIVGGNVSGLQVSGINNTDLEHVTGLQVSGINNMVRKNMTGLQVGGVYNHVGGKTTGVQLAGIGNYSREKLSGAQIAGVGNFSNREMNGLQLAPIFNYAKKVKGVQIGLINVSNVLDGYSIGLVTVVFKGYHKLAISGNEVLNTNIAFKTGSRKFYNILQAGMNVRTADKLYSFGYGLGTELSFTRWLSLNPELTAQQLYMGDWHELNLLNKAHLNLNLKFGKYFSIFGGPSLAVYYSTQTHAVAGYQFSVPPPRYKAYQLTRNLTGWIGWNAGINLF